MSKNKMKSIKEYFENLNATKSVEPVALISSQEETVDDDTAAEVPIIEDKVKVVKIVNAFEALMSSSRGDTPIKTPRKRIRRLGGTSTSKR